VECYSRSIVQRFEFVLRTRDVLFYCDIQYFLFSTLLSIVFNIFLSLFYYVSSVQYSSFSTFLSFVFSIFIYFQSSVFVFIVLLCF
jgi:hypothetical protein